MRYKKFKSPDGTKRRVEYDCSIIVIGEDWQRVPEDFWQSAYGAGCVSEDMFENEAVKKVPKDVQISIQKAHARQEMINNEVLRMMKENEIHNFDSSGRPKILALNKALGIKVQGFERDTALHEAKKVFDS